MSDVLAIHSFDSSKRVEEGNRFLLGNGHLGYRGVLEEERKESLKGFNIVGVYDRYGDKWRESLNLPDPLSFKCFFEGEEESAVSMVPLAHKLSLNLDEAVLHRESEFPSLLLRSERFLSQDDDRLLACRILVTAKKEGEFRFRFGLDQDIYEINGPHFARKKISKEPRYLLFEGKTNEGKTIYEAVSYIRSKGEALYQDGFYEVNLHLKEKETFVLYIYALVLEEETNFGREMQLLINKGYEKLKKEHIALFSKMYFDAKIAIEGDKEGENESSYSIYHLLILGDKKRDRSIPARGVSGQTYKGAIFWDSEIFLLPFFSLTDPKVARNLILYRAKTLPGAKAKAKEFGYEGAFYSWESQETGLEACSKYNVTDYLTGEPIRTYFNEKQIHISADIPYAIKRYVRVSGDEEILKSGAMEVVLECACFFASYAVMKEDGLYHLDDVIGPDEYHERVNDNAFTNYMVKHAVDYALFLLKAYPEENAKKPQLLIKLKDFSAKLYLPRPNAIGVIEQFDGYFAKEDCTLEEVKKRVRDPRQYWGGKDGLASSTQIIKQADVVALLALLSDEFPISIKKANYDYYFPRTEHGSSLSSSMYSLLASEIGDNDYAYEMFRKSAAVDLYGPQKLFAGGVYIGGTHPASAGGAYMSLVYGFAGLKINDDGSISVKSRLPKPIDSLRFKIKVQGTLYLITVNKGEAKAEAIS
jgi:nigerose phosphorylase